MRSAKPEKTGRRHSARRAPATEGLGALDQDRAASLADEGGAAGAGVEAPDRAADARARGTSEGSLLCELTVIPLGTDVHISDELARVLELVDASGLAYQLGPAGTCIEGSWEELLPLVRACHDRARESSKHVITILKIEDDEGQRDKIRRNVESVERQADRTLSAASA